MHTVTENRVMARGVDPDSRVTIPVGNEGEAWEMARLLRRHGVDPVAVQQREVTYGEWRTVWVVSE